MSLIIAVTTYNDWPESEQVRLTFKYGSSTLDLHDPDRMPLMYADEAHKFFDELGVIPMGEYTFFDVETGKRKFAFLENASWMVLESVVFENHGNATMLLSAIKVMSKKNPRKWSVYFKSAF